MLLQLLHVEVGEPFDGSVAFGGEVGPDVEEFVLDFADELVHPFGVELAVVGQQPDVGVELVDGAVGLDAHVVLADAFSAHECGGAVVAGECVDFAFHCV